MVTTHVQRWVVGGALWPEALVPASLVPIARPILVKLQGDRFIERLNTLLAGDDAGRTATLKELQVRDDPASPPRLFQPAHGHYTVVMASLVCTLPGLPEHAVGPRDSVAFVVRRLGERGEYAWIPKLSPLGTPDGGTWHPIALAELARVQQCQGVDEELLPLFPVMWSDAGRMRRSWSGVVPVSARERYEGGAVALDVLPASGAPQFWQDTLEARCFAVIAGLQLAHAQNAALPASQRRDLSATEESATRFALLDLAELLTDRLGHGWIDASGAAASVSQVLNDTKIPHSDSGATSMRDAAAAALDHRAALIVSETWTGAPRCNFALLPELSAFRATLLARLALLVPGEAATPAEAVPNIPAGGGTYVIRCVYRRPPCGVRTSELLSEPTVPFRMAGFLDLDAPHRPTRISLPNDLSFANLRELKKSVGIVMSAAMRQKTEAAATKDIVDGKLRSVPASGLGWITLWSIPIITICAIVLMMIIAGLLNLVFWWLPFLRINIPITTNEEAGPQ